MAEILDTGVRGVNKIIKEKLKLAVLAYLCIIISILSMFTTIVSYTNSEGVYRSFSVLDFLMSDDYDTFVSGEYAGPVYWSVPVSVVRIFVVIAVLAEISAIVGLAILSKQKKTKWSFIFTIAGLIGMMAPCLLILIGVVLLADGYQGVIASGIYPIVSMTAMIISLFAVMRIQIKNMEYQKKLNEAEGLIFRAGDL